MNDQKLDIIINLLKQGQGGKEAAAEISQLDEANKKAAKSSGDLSALMGTLKTAVAALGIAAVVRESVAAFEEQEQAFAKLDGTLRASGRYTAEFSDQLKELADSLEGVTRFDDTKILGAVTQLISAGAGGSEIERLTRITLDFAAAMGTDAESAAISLGKALQGEFASFQRFGFQLDENKTKSEQLRDLLTQLEGRFKGIAETQGGTASGAMVQFKNNVDDLKKSIGELIVQLSNPALTGINDFIKYGRKSTKELEDEARTKIADARRTGAIDSEQARMLREMATEGFGPRKTGGSWWEREGTRPATAGEAQDAFRSIEETIAKLSRAPVVPTGDTAAENLALEDRRKGLLDLAKLQTQISLESLDGFDKERAAAIAAYDERLRALEKIRASGVDVTEALAQAEQEKSAKIDAIWAKEGAALDAKAQKEVEAQQKANGQIIDLRNELALAASSGYDREFLAAEQSYNQIIEQVRALAAEKRISAEEEAALQDLAAQGYELQREAIARTIEEQKRQQFWLSDTGQLVVQINQQFASGFSRAFVEFASGSKSAEEAFKTFGASFLQMVAQMITQMLVLRALSSLFGFAAGGASGVAGGVDGAAANPMAFGTPMMAAGGGQFPRLMAEGGMQGIVSSATYLPRFNAIAGEAGAELLTVMARPRMFDVGGMTATVGDVGGSRMAVLPEKALTDGVVGGRIQVDVVLSPDLEGRITANSVRGAVTQVINDLGRKTPVSSAVQKLVA